MTTSAARTRFPSLAAAALLLCGAAACGLNPPPPAASLETLDSLSLRARNRDPEALALYTPVGYTLPFLSDPYAPGVTAKQATLVEYGGDGINVFPAFSEGRAAAYAVTEYWDGFPKVWLQPLYFLISGFDPATGGPLFVDRVAIFGINTGSRFYSSYWQIYYVRIPDKSTLKASDLSSEKAIFDSGFPLIKGAVTFCALSLNQTNLAWSGELAADGKTKVTAHPLVPTAKIKLRGTSLAWVEGEQVWSADFGRNRFLLDPADPNAVEADALFKFAIRDANGHAQLLPLPSVGGTGPLYHWVRPKLVQGVPQFGTLWREYSVILNPTNGGLPGANHPPAPFIPQARPGLRKLVADAINSAFAGSTSTSYGELYTPLPDAAIEANVAADPALAEYTLRVARNPFECFQQPNPTFPKGPAEGGVCVWLDSQRAVEENLGELLIRDTGRFSSCPLVWFNGAATP